MASRTPTPDASGPGPLIRRLLPIVVMGIALALLLAVVPNFLSPSTPQPTPDAAATASAVAAGGGGASGTAVPAPTAPPDDSARTRIWNLVLVHPLEAGLQFLASGMGLGAGAAIILFTIVVRLALLPLTIQQMRSQKKMTALQPEIKALQKKHGGDREKIGAETMALYKERGINPAAGCFPLVLQMPVLFALYAALSNLAHTDPAFQQPWLWVDRLDQPDTIVMFAVTLPFILPVLAALTQWVQQRMMTQRTDDPQQRLQNQMMQFMPLMMLWFGLSFSAGLALYWVTQSVVGIVQQYFSTGWGSLLPARAAATNGAPSSAAVDRRNGALVPSGDGSTSGGGGSSQRPDGRPRGAGGQRSGGSGGKGGRRRSGGQR